MTEATTMILRVADMNCGHCAGAITKAVESGAPGARVTADPGTKLVSVDGVTDPEAVKALIRAAGYTPGEA